MFKLLKAYMKKPVPYVETYSIRFFMSLFFGVFIFGFLLIFQPFGINDYPESVFFKSLGYGVVTFVIMLVNAFLLPIVLPEIFDPNNFKIKYLFLTSIWFLVSIAIANWFYSSVFYYEESSISLVKFLLVTIAVGIFPMIIGGYYMEKKLNKAKQIIANEATHYLNQAQDKIKNKLYFFYSENNNEQLELETANLICIKSEGNYCEFYYHSDGDIKKQLLRITLRSVEESLGNEQTIIRCHRSYLVNLKMVKIVSGTARNLSLHIENMKFSLPVSRSREISVTKAIRHMK